MKMWQRRLLVRVYLFGILLFVCVAAAQSVVARTLLGPVSRPGMQLHVTWIIDHALPAAASPAELTHDLQRLHGELGFQSSVYDAAGRLLSSTMQPPFPPLSTAEYQRLRPRRLPTNPPRTPLAIGRFVDGQLIGYVLVKPPHTELPLWYVIMPMLLILLVVAGASVPFARSLTKPLERLAATARRLGQGDLQVREATDRKDEVGDLARAFNEMADRIGQLLHAEKALLANVSHELRTPLARIRVAMELCASGGQKVNYLPEIAEDLGEIERMVDDILTAARLDLAQDRVGRPTATLRLSPTDPRQVLARAVARFSDHHPDRELVVEVPAQLPTLQADPAMLRRALDNLLENAHKYSNADCAIELRARTVTEDGPQTGIEIVVSDHGIGIDEVDLPQVFTPFFRSDRSRARKTGGVGLGLPLARRIVSAHGGDIQLRSQVGVGTTATVRLPVAAALP